MVYRGTSAPEAPQDVQHRLILDAATRLFGSYGYYAATMAMIVTDANSSVGSFYAHFRNSGNINSLISASRITSTTGTSNLGRFGTSTICPGRVAYSSLAKFSALLV
jgi:hypothetical protein